MDYRLQDLVDIPVLQEMLDKLHEAIPLSFSILDVEGKLITGNPSQDICGKFHRRCRESAVICEQSDRRISKHFLETLDDIVYTCPHGMIDSATPIIIDGKYMANLVIGQLFLEQPDEQHFIAQAKLYGFDESDYIEALRKVPVITRAELDKALAMLRIFTVMLGDIGRKRLDELKALEALRESNEKLRRVGNYNRSLIEANTDAMAVVGADGRITDANEAALRMTGLTREEITGAPAGIFSINIEAARAVLSRAYNSGRFNDFEADIRHTDGSLTPVLFNASTISFDDGKPKVLLLTARDLTQRKKYEEEISRAEQYRLLADNSTDVIARMTPEGVCTYISPASKKVMGYSPEELSGVCLVDLLHPDDMAGFQRVRMGISLSSSKTFTFDSRIKVKDGSYLWVEANGQVFYGADGRPTEVQAAMRDISEHKRAEQERKAASALIHDLYDHAPCGYHTIDSDGTYISVNDTELSWLGYTREEMIGKMHVTDIMTAKTKKTFARRRQDDVIINQDAEFIRKDGSMFPALINSTAVYNEQGKLITRRATMYDITERLQAEAALKQSEEQYRLLAENSTDIIIRTDIEGDFLYVSPAAIRLTGYELHELIGQNIRAFMHEDDQARLVSINEELVQAQTPLYFSYRYRKKDGLFIWLETFARPVFDSEGHFIEIQAAARDITERKQAEEELKQAKEYAEELINTANAMVLVLDENGRVVEFNRAASELTGWAKSDLVGRDWFETLVPRAKYPQVWSKYKHLADKGFPANFENPILTRSGEERHIVWHNSMLHAGGKVTGMVSFGMDVTERMQMETELRTYKEKLDLVMKNLDAVIFQADKNGILTLIEGQGFRKINRTKDQLLGMAITDIFHNDPAHVRAVKQALSGRRSAAEYSLAESGVVFDLIYMPYTILDGKQDGIIGLAVDITERKQAEQNLHAEKERLKVTLQSIGDGVIATDGEGKIVLMNGVAEELTGWKSHDAEGRRFSEVFDIYNEMTGAKCANPVEKVLASGNIIGLANHTALRAANGTIRSIADSAAPILDESHRILGVILVFRDVTEAKKKENEITYLSYHDKLTGLYNRTFFEEETRRLDTGRQLPMSVIMGDVNGLKLTNDVFGHAEGDNLLVRITGILRDCCRNEDIVARVGGDEFCILLPKTSYASASDICKRIYSHCEKAEYGLPKGGAKLSISLGFATKTSQQDNIAGVMKAAEDSMYRRKLLESRSQHSFLISSIRMTLFEKSFETEQHAQRLIAYSKTIAQALNLPDDQINDIELFALLHDIGKIAIDSHILTKTEKLDEAEWAEMRRHPEIGFRIAQASPDLAHIAEYILCHHERWDGQGYPQGLKGTAIPLLARILIVVDAYDAMTQDRVYRKAMTRDQACAELLMNAGTQFDPNIVGAFMELLEHERYSA